MPTPSYREELISQIPALQVLIHLGYEYLNPAEALALREGKKRSVVLTGILEPWLRTHNTIDRRGEAIPFTDSNIEAALRRLTTVEMNRGLVNANEAMTDLLTLGTSLPQTLDGDTRSYSLHYIDWQHPENNVYHVTEEFSVERTGSYQTRRPDIVCFVNGIPLVVIECKRPDKESEHGKGVEEGVSQHIRNQKPDEIPHLFAYSQLLLAISTNDAKYATTGTDSKFWSVWKEENLQAHEAATRDLIGQPLSEDQQARLYDWRDDAYWVRRHFDSLADRLPTEQDRTLFSLLHPARLLELAYQFMVFDGGRKKVARYQQYFAIQATLDRVAHLNAQGQRTGGVIWHTTGSGKSLTMVMLAKALALHPAIANPRVVIVTDRVNLDEQIYGTFKSCGKTIEKANSGRNLIDLVNSNRADIIATTVHKFETVAQEKVTSDEVNVFMLVDESHRTQYGRLHSMMRQVFRNACYIGFTGTPLTRAEKDTAARFGGFIHKYTMRQAVEDGTVVPLLYEGRIVSLDQNQAQIDKWFERHTAGLSDAEKADLKRKMSRAGEISKADQRIQEIAYDVVRHFILNFRGTGAKAQLATSSKEMAIKYLRYIEEARYYRDGVEHHIDAAVVISPPDTREGHESIDDFTLPEVQAFWQRMMDRYKDEDGYNREILRSFGDEEGIQILIVVDKLLVGFDEPRNTVLYIDKPLKEHGILQAIARVNRLFEGKDYGYVVDYRGVLGELNEAMQTYNALEEFDPEDVAGTITDIAAEVEKLPQLHSDLWAVFNAVDTDDAEAVERFLEPEDVRHRFYDALTAYARSLRVALSSVVFYEQTPERTINAYKRDLQFFHNLRMSVKLRYAEAIDYKEYEQKIRKLLDDHISAEGTRAITDLVNIFDRQAFDREVERVVGAAARADTIAYRLKRTIAERMEQDPAFYRRFSELIDETIEAYYQGRIDELTYLGEMEDALEQVRTGQDRNQPAILAPYKHAPAYYGIMRGILSDIDLGEGGDQLVAEMAVGIEEIIEQHKIRDWADNPDVLNRIMLDIEDHVFAVMDEIGVSLPDEVLDMLIDNLVDLSRKRAAL
ncbi:MAG: type I restriction endonuclease subunit R [Anaerolineae bacterium]|nr:type I restriction endonuclease subunit R [Anaerolineae bacterium]